MPIEWAVRSSILILVCLAILKLFRLKDPFTALAAWTAALFASFSIPFLFLIPHQVRVGPVPELPASIMTEIQSLPAAPHAFNWPLAFYLATTAVLLLRLTIGLAMSHGLKRASRATDRGFRESEAVNAPVTIGILRPEIVLPAEWRAWDAFKIEAVLAHERSHIARRDPAIQALSTVHRAILWFTPFSWYLHSRLVRLAEQASDDAAVAATRDRAQYADLLLGFIRQGGRSHRWEGLSMARYGKAEDRIHRILDGATLSSGFRKRAVGAIALLVSPLTWIVAVGQISDLPKPRPPIASQVPAAPRPSSSIAGLGSVKAVTVVVKPRVEGQLESLGFREGEMVKRGQLLATVDIGPTAIEIHSPIAGLAGLRMIDPGNLVEPNDTIVVIAELQPISVIFTVPEDTVPALRNRVGATVEAWNRDNSRRLAVGKLLGSDNLIDEQTGTTRMKAVFDNADGALFPNQFVNVKVVP